MSNRCAPAEKVALQTPLLASRSVRRFHMGPMLLPLLCCALLLLSGSSPLLDSAAPVSPPRFGVLLLVEAVIYTLPSGQRMMPGPGLAAQSVTADSLRVAGVDVVTALQEMLQQAQQMQADSAAVTARVDAVQAQLNTLDGEAGVQSLRATALLTPTQVQATASSGQAEVQWSMASTKVTATPGGKFCVASGLDGERACTVTGLTNGEPYTFTAQRINSAESGPLSPLSAAVTPVLACRALIVATAGDGGTVTVSPTNSAGCPPGEYSPGAVVIVTAIPDAGFGVSWCGPDSGVADDVQLTFTLIVGSAATPIVASFSRCVAITLAVASGIGTGTVEALPNHSPGCVNGSFTIGSRVILRAKPADGYLFGGWYAPVSAGPSASTLSFVVPTSATTVQALFGQCVPLSIRVIGNGSVSVEPTQSPGCASEGVYLSGALVSLTAIPAAGFTFGYWSGATMGSNTVLSFTMPALPASLNATFAPPRVYGQPSPASSLENNPSAAAGGVNYPFGLAFDMLATRNVMYVSDAYNNRVLQYALGGQQLGVTPLPVRVIGQADFSVTAPNRGAGSSSNTTANSLYSPRGLACDTLGGLYVIDSNNNRALYFPFGAENATRVYGQSGSFTTSNYAVVSADTLSLPCGIALAPDGVYISDTGNHRVLFFSGDSTTATRVYGQTGYTTKSSGTSASKFNTPVGLVVDNAGGLYIADWGNNRVVYYAPGNTTAASRVYGQDGSFTSNTANLGGISASSLSLPYDVTLASNGTLYISDSYNNRIVAYAPGDSSATYRVWGQDSFTSGASNKGFGATETTLFCPTAVRLDPEGRLFVVDSYNHRVIEQL